MLKLMFAKETWIPFFVAFYIAWGTFFATLFGMSIPALNWKGKVYISFAWSYMLVCEQTDLCTGLPPMFIAEKFFTFED